mmetsp:Transcript_88710/g.251504  ORF Transcript_88710/g.251504 Transcript_88710/m.251504 type:complete len:461 (+) Transcript_88710:65-1447(+)
MARVNVLPESDTVRVVDASLLLAGRPPPAADPITGAPTVLTSFVVSTDPRIVVVPHFLTSEECKHLQELAEGHYTRSLVGALVDDTDGIGTKLTPARKVQSKSAQTRTSTSSKIRPAQTMVVQRIEDRLSNLAGLPVEQLESPVVVRYSPGERFNEHHDGKFRPRTVFIYLNDLPDGDEGDTFFPHLGFSFIPREGCAVMWSNCLPGGMEDSRMVHAGRPPLTSVKYGVNCFFNELPVRLMETPVMCMAPSEAFSVDLQALGEQGRSRAESRTFVLDSVPPVTAVRGFASDAQVEQLLQLAGEARQDLGACGSDVFPGGTKVLRTLRPAETPEVHQLELHLVDAARFPIENLAPMRVVRTGVVHGLCNRGCGQKSALVCLSDEDEVLFPHLGLRVALRRGDMLLWPNAWRSEPYSDEPDSRKRVVEDMRTARAHLPRGGGARTLALDVAFYDTAIRAAIT